MFNARAILRANGSTEKVCRNLFGETDHEQIKKDFKELMSTTLEEAKRTWNFDFETDTPLEGNFVWERVDGQQEETREEDGDKASKLVPLQELESKESISCKRKQTVITDYYQVKRRCSPLPSPCQCSP
ncbi:cyclin-dependent kinase inhibitor 1 [Engystomops pustulosus]|uniref:cyclin-dependent kinase inhibitor 1 n=1 Tax=Engystomops pustulosus TaxID=76066 RepID=UPI003AFB66E9